MRFSFRHSGRRRGTSLVEILVVIVVFLIGILAVAQIFPGGFKILVGTRARSLASTIARAQSERLKSRPDLLPEAILPVRIEFVGAVATAIVSEEKSPNDYAPTASGIDQNGNAIDVNGSNLNVPWGRLAGANTFRRVVGETHVVGAPRFLSPVADPTAGFGGLVTLEFGPMDYNPTDGGTLGVYGRDLYRRTDSIASTTPASNPATLPPLSATDVPREYEYILANAANGDQALYPSGLLVPAPIPTATYPTPTPFRYSLSLAVYISTGGVISRREVELPSPIAVSTTGAQGYAFLPVATIPGVVPTGSSLVGVDADSVRLARSFRLLAATDPFSQGPTATDPDASPADPYEYKILNPFLGTLLFNPVGYNRFEQRPGEARRPFAARLNYNVYDWRVLREDFRIPRERFDTNATPMPPSVRLAISPLRARDETGADGIRSKPMEEYAAPYIPAATRATLQDHFVLLDLETGGIYYETYNGKPLIDVNKSTGRVKFLPYNATGDMTGWLALPGGGIVEVPIANRAVRAFYVGKDEWAVQVLRAPERYTRFLPTMGTPRPVTGTYYLGASDTAGILAGASTRVYFPPADFGRKVTIGRISYIALDGATRVKRTFEGGDFVLRYGGNDLIGPSAGSPPSPWIDIKDVDSQAVDFDLRNAAVADGANDQPLYAVRGASVLVRVFHTDAKFFLGTDSALNLTTNFDRYLRQWRVDSKETFLDGGEPAQ